MHVFWQDDAGDDGEGHPGQGVLKGVPQGVNRLRGGEDGAALVGYDGEEVGATRDIGAAVFHEMIIAFGIDVGFRAGDYEDGEPRRYRPQPNLRLYLYRAAAFVAAQAAVEDEASQGEEDERAEHKQPCPLPRKPAHQLGGHGADQHGGHQGEQQ